MFEIDGRIDPDAPMRTTLELFAYLKRELETAPGQSAGKVVISLDAAEVAWLCSLVAERLAERQRHGQRITST